MNLTKRQHAQVLQLYLARLPITELRKILFAKERSLHAAMNLGSRAQAIYAEDEDNTVAAAVASLTDHDLNVIQHQLEIIFTSAILPGVP